MTIRNSRPHGAPETVYRPQHTDLAKFGANYTAIDWSRKMEAPVKLEPATTRVVMPLLPVLVACHTDVQLRRFCQTHMLRPQDVHRVQRMEHICGFKRDRPILLLPDWWQGTTPDCIPDCERHGWKTARVTEEQVLGGTYFSDGIAAPPPETADQILVEEANRIGDMEVPRPIPNPDYAKECFMCHATEPRPKWLELLTKPRVVCSHECYLNYAAGDDII